MSSKNLLFRCQSLYQVLDRYLDRELSLVDRMLIKGHLIMCAPCRNYLQQYKKVRTVVDSPVASQLPEDFEEVMHQVVRRWREDPQSSSSAEESPQT